MRCINDLAESLRKSRSFASTTINDKYACFACDRDSSGTVGKPRCRFARCSLLLVPREVGGHNPFDRRPVLEPPPRVEKTRDAPAISPSTRCLGTVPPQGVRFRRRLGCRTGSTTRQGRTGRTFRCSFPRRRAGSGIGILAPPRSNPQRAQPSVTVGGSRGIPHRRRRRCHGSIRADLPALITERPGPSSLVRTRGAQGPRRGGTYPRRVGTTLVALRRL